jgi:SAM-dependent methyltransferase
MPETKSAFYDELASYYHLIFEDWEASMARQAAALAPMLQRECRPGARLLDCACGIGTQMLGLAKAGFELTGSDLSAPAGARARQEAESRGLKIPVFVADMRDLSTVPGTFDAVIAMDNALPHLESAGGLLRAVEEVRSKLGQGGVFLASIRDYDTLIRELPQVQGPAFYSDAGRRRIVFQLWDWMDERRYRFHLYITCETESGWQTHHAAAAYRAILREELSAVLRVAGFADVRWMMPEESGFYQPVVLARAASS